MINKQDLPLETLRATVLPAWADVERRGAQLLLVVPVFGGILLAGASFAIPETPVPALIVLAASVLSLVYLMGARRRLQKLPVLLLSARVRRKHLHQSTNRTTHVETRRHYLELDVYRVSHLSRQGQLTGASLREQRPKLSTSKEIYGHVAEGEEITAIVMPHDGAIYFMLDMEGRLFPPPASAAA